MCSANDIFVLLLSLASIDFNYRRCVKKDRKMGNERLGVGVSAAYLHMSEASFEGKLVLLRTD